jgi:tRNA A37 threonylcarbamoyladenosine dehydratase
VIRAQCKKRGIRRLKVAYSTEPALKPAEAEEPSGRRATPGSMSFVPSVMGLIIAGEVVKDLIAR